MKNNVIFIAGVHGVGKSTIGKSIAKRYNINLYTASSIINKNKHHSKKSVYIKEMRDNQSILIDGLKELQNKNEMILLDGHFTLFKENNEIVKIPFENYLKLNICAILVLVNKSEKICKNLKLRDKKNYSIDLIEKMQKLEVEYAKEVSSQLKVNISIFDINEEEKIFSKVKSILGEGN